MNAKQYAWTHVVTTGYPERKKSFYGGYDFSTEPGSTQRVKKFKSGLNSPFVESYYDREKDTITLAWLNQIKTIGVDWEKTQSPESFTAYKFSGTFAEHHDYEEVLSGHLILKDGKK